MGGQSNGYQSQPMQSWGYGGGYGGSGSGGGYGMGNYNNNFSNRAPMYGQQSSQNYGGIQGGGGGQGGGGSFSGGNMAWRDPNSPLYNWDQTHAGGQQGGFGQQSSQNYGGSGGSQQPMSYDAYMQPQGFGWNNNFSNGFGGWNQFGGWPQFNGFQSGWQPQYQQPQSQQPQFSPASQDMNQDMVPTRAQGMVRLPPINYDQYQKQPNQYEYLNGGNSPFSQVA
jgi:hypothetical protein